MSFDPKQYQARIATVASIMDVTDVSLDKFRAKGGKIILTHGTADDFITPHNTELYYQRQVKQFGQAGVDSFIRFYMKQVLPRVGWFRRRNQSTLKLVEYYWATIAECVAPKVILSALEAGGFQNVKRTTTGKVLSEYVAQR